MSEKKIDIIILVLLGLLVAGLVLALALPRRYWVIPTYGQPLRVNLYQFFLGVGVLNIPLGLVGLKIRDITIRKFWTFTWMLEMGVVGFVFVSIYSLRVGWGILPFYAGIRSPVFSLRILPAIAVFIAGILFFSRWDNDRFGVGQLAVLVLFSILFNLVILAVNPDFVSGVTRTFSREKLEYYGDIKKVDSDFLFHYTDKMPHLSLHGKTHPPLAILFLWILNKMGFEIFGSSIITALFGSFTLVFVYKISQDLFGEEAARTAVGIFWLVPAVVLYSAVSMDALFMFLATVTVFFFQRALYQIRYAFLLAFFFSLALFSSFVTFFLLLIFAFWAGIGYFRGSLAKGAFRNLAWGAVITVLIHLALYFVLDYNVLEVFSQARRLNSGMMGGYLARPYKYWVVGNLVDYFVFLGLPVIVVVGLYMWKIKNKFSASDVPFVAVLLTILVFDVSGLVRREVARVWLIFTPLLIASVADFLTGLMRESRKVFPFIATLLFLQNVFFEIFTDTLW